MTSRPPPLVARLLLGLRARRRAGLPSRLLRWLPPMRRLQGLLHVLLLGLLLCALPGCTSASDGPPVVRTKIDYDSTRDGPRPEVVDEGAPVAPPDPSTCTHAWEAVPRGTHAYPDPSDPLGMAMAICTPVVCTKCGLVRHECQRRRRR